MKTMKSGKGVKAIGARAFKGCSQLAQAKFEDGLESVGAEAFSGCWRMKSVSLPLSASTFGSNVFTGCSSLENVAAPTRNASGLFAPVAGTLRTVTVQPGETTIANGTFRNCTALEAVVIPGSLASIGDYAFYGCSNLNTLHLPSGLASVGNYAFAYCRNLRSVYFLGNAPSCGSGIYDNANWNLTTYVIQGTFGWDGRATSRDIPQSWNGRTITTWEARSYRVHFDPNGGTGTMLDQTFTTGMAAALSVCGFARDGWTFAGWSRTAFGAVEYEDGQVVRNLASPNEVLVLYAVWKRDGGDSSGGGASAPDAGELDASFASAQLKSGALYDAEGELVGMVQLKVGKKNKNGEVKVSASAMMILDGKSKKISAKAVTIKIDDGGASGILSLKEPIGDMEFIMEPDGSFTLENDSYFMDETPVGGNLPNGPVMFMMFADAMPDFGEGMDVIDEALPDLEQGRVTGGKKFDFGKAGGLKFKKNKDGGFELVGLDDPVKPNVSALKISYAPKTGIFKGSFKVYATDEASVKDGKKPKLKKATAKIVGIFVNESGMKGSGQATVKGVADCWRVEIK